MLQGVNACLKFEIIALYQRYINLPLAPLKTKWINANKNICKDKTKINIIVTIKDTSLYFCKI